MGFPRNVGSSHCAKRLNFEGLQMNIYCTVVRCDSNIRADTCKPRLWFLDRLQTVSASFVWQLSVASLTFACLRLWLCKGPNHPNRSWRNCRLTHHIGYTFFGLQGSSTEVYHDHPWPSKDFVPTSLGNCWAFHLPNMSMRDSDLQCSYVCFVQSVQSKCQAFKSVYFLSTKKQRQFVYAPVVYQSDTHKTPGLTLKRRM